VSDARSRTRSFVPANYRTPKNAALTTEAEAAVIGPDCDHLLIDSAGELHDCLEEISFEFSALSKASETMARSMSAYPSARSRALACR